METPKETLQLHLRCSNLPRMDVMSKSDPFVVIFQAFEGGQERELGRTEVIKDCHEPDFHTIIPVTFFFERVQTLRFVVYDEDKKNSSLQHQDFIGELKVTVSELMGGHRGSFSSKLNKRNGIVGKGMIHVVAESVSEVRGNVTIDVHAVKIDKKDFFGKSDPFLTISRYIGGQWQTVHQTETIMKTLNPHWKPFISTVSKLCNGNTSTQLLFQVFDYDKNSNPDFIGCFQASLEQIAEGSPSGKGWPLINAKKKEKRSKYTDSGVMYFPTVDISTSFPFSSFLRAGLQISCSFGVDFTASNGNPKLPTSLHFHAPGGFNEYATAIFSVGRILQDYDTDKLFPAFGFGLKLDNGAVVHSHPLNGNYENPFCNGIQGVLDAYYNTLARVQLWGPTNFSPIIQQAASVAARSHEQFQEGVVGEYHILCIITDGVITDMADTKSAIVSASNLPLSIVIVGVGAADFGRMDELDSDGVVLTDVNGMKAARDMVQFVQFRNYGNNSAELAAAVLEEIPNQVEEYCGMFKVVPRQ
eukprot:m.88312 g.88312  ORF g.88312 m.88312 type:complete len:529 (+) comp8805_c0_seq3:22-1608(+)